MKRGVARYVRLFRPHPSLRANCLQFFFPTRGKAYGWMPCVGTLACFALIRRWRATFPTRGKATTVFREIQRQRRFIGKVKR